MASGSQRPSPHSTTSRKHLGSTQLKVIGAGLGRTGTESLKQALELLGYAKCYHMWELIQHPEHLPAWQELGEGRRPDYDRLFEGYQSTSDFPAALYYREFMAEFPDAKVILTVRDSQRWFESASRTILRRIPSPVLGIMSTIGLASKRVRAFAQVNRYARALVHDGFFEGRVRDPAHTIAIYDRWNEEVRRTVPHERLLVFEVKEGWGPLCAFLGCAVPDLPFPRSNDSASFDRTLLKRLFGSKR